MPEGHTIHRAAKDHRKILVGSKVSVKSPQGRFSHGADILDKMVCLSVEAFGKHLIYEFEQSKFLHIHLGLFGRIRKSRVHGSEPRGQVRIRLEGKGGCVDISGPTICEIIDLDSFNKLVGRIGPDLLRDDADSQKFIERVKRSKARIGALLMNQSVVAGIGNIYRTELLWRQKIHPCTLGKNLGKRCLQILWDDARRLLKTGMRRNRIITAIAENNNEHKENLNIYKKDQCPRCFQNISKIEISKRTVYFCPNCQSIK